MSNKITRWLGISMALTALMVGLGGAPAHAAGTPLHIVLCDVTVEKSPYSATVWRGNCDVVLARVKYYDQGGTLRVQEGNFAKNPGSFSTAGSTTSMIIERAALGKKNGLWGYWVKF